MSLDWWRKTVYRTRLKTKQRWLRTCLHRGAPGSGSNPEPCCWEAAVLTTVSLPPKHFSTLIFRFYSTGSKPHFQKDINNSLSKSLKTWCVCLSVYTRLALSDLPLTVIKKKEDNTGLTFHVFYLATTLCLHYPECNLTRPGGSGVLY